jgi:glucose-1-phosphate adenylyltransferase
LILGGDQLYRMDFAEVVGEHIASRAEVTVAVTPVQRDDASRYGILKLDATRAVTEFVEKPAPDALDALETERGFLGSMGIYIFDRAVLEEELRESDEDDFGHGILPSILGRRRLFAYVFDGYFEDVGTIGTFYHANLDLTDPLPRFNFYEPLAPIYTRPRFLPGSKIDDCTIVRSLVTEGVILDHCRLERSVIGIRSRIQRGATVSESLIMGADFYQLPDAIQSDIDSGIPPMGIGEGAVVERAIVDKNARIGSGVKIVNAEGRTEADGDNYYIRDGVVVIPKGVVVPDGTVI